MESIGRLVHDAQTELREKRLRDARLTLGAQGRRRVRPDEPFERTVDVPLRDGEGSAEELAKVKIRGLAIAWVGSVATARLSAS